MWHSEEPGLDRRLVLTLLCMPQKYQHIYLGVLYGLLVVKAVLVDDFKALADGAIGPLRLARMTNLETAVFWGCKALYIAYFIALPVLRSHHSVVALLALWLISEVVAGWMFAFLFQVSRLLLHDLSSQQLATITHADMPSRDASAMCRTDQYLLFRRFPLSCLCLLHSLKV